MKKTLTLVLSLALAVAIGIGGTLAWLTAQTSTITNTFTVGKVDITLTETNQKDNTILDAETTAQNQTYKVYPAQTITKDPKVTVKADSEHSIVYVKVTKGTDFDTYFEATIADGWTELASVGTDAKVYYREQNAVSADTAADALPSYSVLANNQVTAKNNIDETLNAKNVSLMFQAYAIQYDGLEGDNLAAKANAGWTALNA